MSATVSIRATSRTVWRITYTRPDSTVDLSGTVSASLLVRRPDRELVTWTASVLSATAETVTVQHVFSSSDFIAGRGNYVAEGQLVDGSGLALQCAAITLVVVDI